jgi:hypothetical protein
MQQALRIAQQAPEMVPMMVEMVKFGVGAFKQARQLEGVIDKAITDIQQANQQQKPNPEVQKAQMESQLEQQKMQAQSQIEQAKLQSEAQLEQLRLQHDAQIEQMKQQFDRWKAELDASTKVLVARIGANPGADIPLLDAQKAAAETVANDLRNNVAEALNRINDTHNAMTAMHNQSMENMQNAVAGMHNETVGHLKNAMAAISAPKRIIRNKDGRAIGVEVVQQNLPLNETR